MQPIQHSPQCTDSMQRHSIFVVLASLAVCLSGSTISAPTAEVIDFYKLYDNPEAHISLAPRLTTADRIAAHGYPVEHHRVVTEDGYVLGLFRIPYSHNLQNENATRPIALVQHGLFSCSDAFISMGPNDALAFQLADQGYEVWFGNARGNTYSRNHTTRLTKHPHFWRYSWHEIGYYDIAAMIDYALKVNGQRQTGIHYVGHSQGTTAFFALTSMRPEYNAKIKTAHMLAPVAYMNNMDNELVRFLSPYLGYYNTYSRLFSSQEFLPHNEFVLAFLYNICQPQFAFAQLCDGAIYNEDPVGRYNTSAGVINGQTHPAGVSTDQILHYMQENQSAHFRQFDFGKQKNLKVYGQEYPPDYPTQNITCQMHLWYSDNDDMAAVEDVMRLAATLPNKVMHHMEDPLWDHGDFAFNWEVRKYINEPIIEIMQTYEAEHVV